MCPSYTGGDAPPLSQRHTISRVTVVANIGLRWLFLGVMTFCTLAGAALPPNANIVASSLSGQDALTVQFSCNCQPGDSEIVSYEWRFGLGMRSGEKAPAISFRPGRHNVQLIVTAANGLFAYAETVVVVRSGSLEPPHCSANVAPLVGQAPVEVTWSATTAAGSSPIKKMYWVLDSGEIASESTVVRSYSEAGWYGATVVVEDEQGLKCVDETATMVQRASTTGVPPRIVTVPQTTATCGAPYSYSSSLPRVLGTGTPVWTVESGPSGFTVDPSTGAVSWTPLPSDRGAPRVTLNAETETGVARQTYNIEVACTSQVQLQTPFGCGAVQGGPMVLAMLFWFCIRRRQPS
jgi:PKD repeat protein